MDIFKSKKFQAALAGIIVALLEAYVPALGGLPVEQIIAVLAIYIFGQGVADLGKEKAKVEKNADS